MAPRKKGFGLRLRSRGGSSVRKRWTKSVQSHKSPSVCPSCGVDSVGRISSGVWRCKGCGYTFAGEAYAP